MLPSLAARIDDPIRILSLVAPALELQLPARGRVKRTTLAPPQPSEGPRHYDATQLFSEHGAFVAKFLWRMGAPDSEIEDLVQDVFLVAHLRGGFVEGPARPTTWLASIAFRLWSSERRRFRRHAEMSNDEAVARAEARGPTPAEALVNAESLKRVRAVLEQLEERGRAILILVDLEGASCVEVAEALNIPIGTVYSRLHGARKRFADAYEKLSKEVGVVRSGGAA
jgi:RNA polymerase sigma-70 factor (ECF subfamily)